MSGNKKLFISRRKAVAFVSAGLFSCFVSGVQAQHDPLASYPSKSLRIVVPSAAGSGSDLLTRTLARHLGQSLGQPVVVENKAGASGMIGVETVVRSPADGYTLLMSSLSPVVINPIIYKKLAVDPREGLIPVSKVGIAPVALLVNASTPVKTLADFVALAKSQPLSYGSFGIGTGAHLAMELLSQDAGIKLVHVPYKGTAPAVTDLIAGQISATMADLATSQVHINSGKLRAIAINGGKRSPLLPQVPTFTEGGYPNLENTYASFAVFAPSGTPDAIVKRLSNDIVTSLKLPELGVKFREQGYILEGSTPSELAATLKEDTVRWNTVIKNIGGLSLD